MLNVCASTNYSSLLEFFRGAFTIATWSAIAPSPKINTSNKLDPYFSSLLLWFESKLHSYNLKNKETLLTNERVNTYNWANASARKKTCLCVCVPMISKAREIRPPMLLTLVVIKNNSLVALQHKQISKQIVWYVWTREREMLFLLFLLFLSRVIFGFYHIQFFVFIQRKLLNSTRLD